MRLSQRSALCGSRRRFGRRALGLLSLLDSGDEDLMLQKAFDIRQILAQQLHSAKRQFAVCNVGSHRNNCEDLLGPSEYCFPFKNMRNTGTTSFCLRLSEIVLYLTGRAWLPGILDDLRADVQAVGSHVLRERFVDRTIAHAFTQCFSLSGVCSCSGHKEELRSSCR